MSQIKITGFQLKSLKEKLDSINDILDKSELDNLDMSNDRFSVILNAASDVWEVRKDMILIPPRHVNVNRKYKKALCAVLYDHSPLTYKQIAAKIGHRSKDTIYRYYIEVKSEPMGSDLSILYSQLIQKIRA